MQGRRAVPPKTSACKGDVRRGLGGFASAGDTSGMSDDITDDKNSFGIRDGEVAIELPAQFDASLYFIGSIRTPWTKREDCPKNARESQALCTIAFDPRFAAGLKGIESCSHLVVLYWMDKSRRDLVLQVPRHYGKQRGTFALRSPARPNPIAMSVVRLVKVEGANLSVVGLDCLDNTPLVDLKPYFASTDAVADAVVGWHAERKP
jgi:tRNA-Thr(GGU) m(6)t(6)A37 methyltransferase TsaA